VVHGWNAGAEVGEDIAEHGRRNPLHTLKPCIRIQVARRKQLRRAGRAGERPKRVEKLIELNVRR